MDTNEQKTPIRTVVLGFGLSGRVFHAPHIAADPAYELTAVVTGNPERRAAALEEYPGVRVLDSVDEVWKHTEDVDLVVIGTPSSTHEDLAAKALDAGLHVLVDKPFALTAEGGQALIDKAQDAGRVLGIFQNRRWDGDFLTVSKLIDDGELGEIRRFESRFEKWKPTQDASWKTTSTPEQGGGVIYDLGSHLVDQALQLFGPVREDGVYSETDCRRGITSSEDDAFIALHHVNGVRTQLWMSAVRPAPGPRFQVTGSRAGYTSWGIDGQEQALKDGHRPGDAEVGTTPEERWGTLDDGTGERPVPMLDGDYPAFYSGLAAAIHGTGEVPVDPAGVVEALRIIGKALPS